MPSDSSSPIPARGYAFFISYRHADNKDPARQWASWLHHSLALSHQRKIGLVCQELLTDPFLP